MSHMMILDSEQRTPKEVQSTQEECDDETEKIGEGKEEEETARRRGQEEDSCDWYGNWYGSSNCTICVTE